MVIYDRFRKHNPKLKKHDGLFGVEIETEAKKEYDVPEFYYWNSVKDNSLRDVGWEYILKCPLSLEETYTALNEFGEKTAKLKLIPDSNSTSVHVHMNMLNQKFLTLANLFTTYALYENLLIRFSGPTRRSNLFCLPICDAEQTNRDMVNICQNFSKQNYGWLWDHISEDTNKYAAFNLASLSRLGSVEFRSFRGDPRPEVIKPWVSLLHSLLQFSQRNHFPSDIIAKYRNDSEGLLKEVFGVIGRDILKAAVPSNEDYKKLVEKNLGYAGLIAYSVKDWNLMDKTPDPVKYKQSKALDKYCIDQWGQPFSKLDESMKEIAIQLFKQAGGMLQAEVAQGHVWGNPIFNELHPGQPAPAAQPFGGQALNNGWIVNEPDEE